MNYAASFNLLPTTVFKSVTFEHMSSCQGIHCLSYRDLHLYDCSRIPYWLAVLWGALEMLLNPFNCHRPHHPEAAHPIECVHWFTNSPATPRSPVLLKCGNQIRWDKRRQTTVNSQDNRRQEVMGSNPGAGKMLCLCEVSSRSQLIKTK